MNPSPLVQRFFLAALLGGAPLALRAQAPAPDARSEKEDALKLTTFVVTGSNIPTSADATASPVTIIGDKQTHQAVVDANMLDLLRKRAPAITGRSNIGSSNANN